MMIHEENKITSKEQVLLKLKAANIEYKLFEHEPIFTVNEAKELSAKVSGAHVKNLFLRDKKKITYLLITVEEHKRVDLNGLSNKLKLDRLSFANPHDLNHMLAVEPGSVTPIAIINDDANRVKFLMDSDLLTQEIINIHPMINTATISLKLSDLLAFIESYKKEKVEFIDIPSVLKESK